METAQLERAIRYALQRKHGEDALEEAVKRERAMIDNALDVICTIDGAGKFTLSTRRVSECGATSA
jgi:PAS domain-containing protein